MKKFLVLFFAPSSVLDDWMKKDAETRKTEEAKMSGEWQAWTKENEKMLVDAPAGAGKVKRVTSSGVSDERNDVMMYAVVQAESPEAAAKAFESHPHLQIPESSIEIMPINYLPGMK